MGARHAREQPQPAGRGGTPRDVLLDLLATLDLERLRHGVLAALAGVTDAQSAALWEADGAGALSLSAWRGLVDRAALPERIGAIEAGVAMASASRAGAARDPDAAGEALRVPLVAGGEPVGLALLERRFAGAFGPGERAAAEEVAPFAAVALLNARRFAALERRAVRDGAGAYRLASFVEYAGKRLYEARRYDRGFALAVLGLDGLDDLRRAAGREAVHAATQAVLAALGRTARDADLFTRAADHECYVLLPETDRLGGLLFARRAAAEVRREEAVRALDAHGPLRLALGVATFPADGDDFDVLLAACRARQQEERASLARSLALDVAPLDFWDAADALLGKVALAEGGSSARAAPDRQVLVAASREAARDLGRDPRARSLLYLGLPAGIDAGSVLGELSGAAGAARAGDAGARVHVIAGRSAGAGAHPVAVHLAGDARLEQHGFVLLLSDRAAYGLLLGPGALFHTCDAPLVDALVSRLQAHYELEPL